MSDPVKTHNMVITRHFDAPVAQVWRAWSDGDEVMRWWGPMNFTCPVCEMDFREGGTTLVCMRAPAEYGGQDMYNTWTYTKIVPMERIEFVQRFSDKDRCVSSPASLGLPPGIPMEVPHVITLQAVDNNTAEMTITEYGYANEQIVEISKAGMNQVLDKMAASWEG